MSQDTDVLNIYCDLVNDSLVDKEESDIIYSFRTSVLRPSYSFILEPRRITYGKDGKRRVIDFNGINTKFSLILKRLEPTA